MAKRKIIKIDEGKCNGCGLCIPNCKEGALQIVNGKAKLVSEVYCDGLGACLGHCPQGAITIEEREAKAFDEKKAMGHVAKNERRNRAEEGKYKWKDKGVVNKNISRLETWPVQLKLVPAFAPFLNSADILIAADCVPFAYADFHEDLLKGKILLVGCPKLDDISYYKEKISQIIKNNDIKSITYAHMEVPCCFGLLPVIKEAIASSGKRVLFNDVTISTKGGRIN